VLQHVAVCCSVMRVIEAFKFTEIRFGARCVVLCCSVWQCVAVCLSVPQCVAVCCSTLQRAALCSSV